MEIQTRTPKPIAGSLSPVRPHIHLQVGVAVARALAYLPQHDPPFVHRDVKTANVLLTQAASTSMNMNFFVEYFDCSTRFCRLAGIGISESGQW